MKFHKTMSSKRFILILCVLSISHCGTAEIVQQIDSKIQQKQIIGQQKEQKLLNIFQGGEVLKTGYLELLQNKLGALDIYRAFYMQNLRCQGIKANIQLFIQRGQIIQEPCLNYPLSSEALPHLVRTYILADAQYNTSLVQKTVDAQTQFNQDAENYFAILKTLSLEPIQILRTKLAACMTQYANQFNQHPTQCADDLANLNRIADLHQQKYIDISGPYGSFFQTIHYLETNLTYWQSQLKRLQDVEFEKRGDVQAADVSVKYDQCIAGLNAFRSLANSRLAAVQASFTKIANLKSSLNDLFSDADATIAKAQAATANIRALGEELKQSV